MTSVIFATDANVGVLTLSDAEPETFSARAMMATVPPAYAVTSPEELTFATAVSRLSQEIVRPVSVLPDASVSVAVAWVWPPTFSVALASETPDDRSEDNHQDDEDA